MVSVTWLAEAGKYTLRQKSTLLRKHIPYCRHEILSTEKASDILYEALKGGEPFMAGRMGLFETAVMRMYAFKIRKKYPLVMHNLYECAGFFPEDTGLGEKFCQVYAAALTATDLLAKNDQFLEGWLIDRYMPQQGKVAENFKLYEAYGFDKPWSAALAGKKVLVVTPFTESVEHQYQKREELFPGTDILPEFSLQTYRSLMTIGDMRDERFGDWFEALEFMKKEILALDFDVALLGCGAYGFPLAAAIKEQGRQAVHMGGVLQILFGIMGKRWDGSRFGGIDHMDPKLKRFYSNAWIYPLEGRPQAADQVEYGPYWK